MLELSSFGHIHSQKLLSVSISRMSILVENWGYDSESWYDTLKKQYDNGINNIWTKTDLNKRYSAALLQKISLFSLASTWQPFCSVLYRSVPPLTFRGTVW